MNVVYSSAASAWKIPCSARLCLSSSRPLLDFQGSFFLHIISYISHITALVACTAAYSRKFLLLIPQQRRYRLSRAQKWQTLFSSGRFSFFYVANCCDKHGALPLPAASSFHCHRPGNPTAVPAFSSWHSLVLPRLIASRPWESRVCTRLYHLHVESRVPSSVTVYSLSLNPLGHQCLLLVPSNCLALLAMRKSREYALVPLKYLFVLLS